MAIPWRECVYLIIVRSQIITQKLLTEHINMKAGTLFLMEFNGFSGHFIDVYLLQLRFIEEPPYGNDAQIGTLN